MKQLIIVLLYTVLDENFNQLNVIVEQETVEGDDSN